MSNAKTIADRRAKEILKDVKAELGQAWDYMVPSVREAFVESRVLRLVIAQDEDLNPARVVELAHTVLEAVRAELNK